MNPLVSIIMPCYNSEMYIAKTLKSLQEQTYTDWEVLITDDCSTDKTVQIIKSFQENDSRIRLYELNKNSGAAVARNNSLAYVRGQYVAFLDADDIWYPNKIEMQLDFMKSRHAGFTCASYDVINEDGAYLGRTVHMMDHCDYVGFLTHNLLQTVGIMVDLNVVSKELLVMPLLKRRQDAATWLQILKSGVTCYGIYDSLCAYRRVSNSLSSNKFKAASGVWYLYRKVEKLPLYFSLYCFSRYAFLAVWKRIYKKTNKR